ncbi:MAG: DUF1501 domain-containing protein [Myxococcota bacterium]|nr:DUF1501 domain-containing protein [Myxococcota bacterium]
MTWTRRDLIKHGAALGALSSIGWNPSMARAAQGERKFLFYFAGGAWDTTTVFDPHYGTDLIDMDPMTYTKEHGLLKFTGGEDRPNIERFFQKWNRRSMIVNGLDAHSVGHGSGTKLTLTGTSASSYADWPTTLAANAKGEYPLPHLVFSGPNFAGNSGSAVVRAGGGTLIDLINSSINGQADNPTPVFSPPADSMIDAFVHKQISKFAAKHEIAGGHSRRRSESFLNNTERSMEIEGRLFEAGLDQIGTSLFEQSLKAVEMMRLGLSRTAMLGIPGGWDCHGGVEVNAPQHENFFMALDQLMEYMATTPGSSTQYLIDEVVIVALSEFGRTPRLNGGGGKDHWPFTSAMVIGSGVNGGRTIGATDDALIGLPIDYETGMFDSNGTMLGTENLGVALLKLGGLDPEQLLPGIQPLNAVLK